MSVRRDEKLVILLGQFVFSFDFSLETDFIETCTVINNINLDLKCLASS